MVEVCKFLLEDISFAPDRIVPCGSGIWDNIANVEKYFLKVDPDIKCVDFKTYFNRRNLYISQYKNHEKPFFCQGCEKYLPINVDLIDLDEYKVKKINIYNRTECSCRCIYCCLADFGKIESTLC